MTTTTQLPNRELARRVALAQLARHATAQPCSTVVDGLPCRHQAGHEGRCSVRLLAGQSITLRAW